MSKHSFTLLHKMSWLTGGLVLASTLMTQSYFARHERTSLEMRLREKANFVNNFYAFLIADALQHNDDVTLLQVIDRLEQDPEITSVVVVDGKGEVRYHVDPEKVGSKLEDPLLKNSLETGQGYASDFQNAGGKALALVSPLKIRGQGTPQGAIRIEFTYRHIRDQVDQGHASFHAVAMGGMFMCIGGILWGIRKWVLVPVQRLKGAVTAINPATLDTTLPEMSDEFGEISAALNEFLAKLKVEWASRQDAVTARESDERVLIEQLVRGLMPDMRALIIDKGNRVVCDTQRENTLVTNEVPHLLDVVTDKAFVDLLGIAVQKEGEITRGAVVFQDKPYEAAILRILEGQSKTIKMVVALSQIK